VHYTGKGFYWKLWAWAIFL